MAIKKSLILLLIFTTSISPNGFDINNKKIEKIKETIEWGCALSVEKSRIIFEVSQYYRLDFLFVKYIFDVTENFYGVDFLVLMSLIKIESDFKTDAVSRTGAVGLCQITTSAVSDLDTYLDKNKWSENILIGAMFLDKLQTRYQDIFESLRHYNVGTKNIKDGERYARKVLEEYKLLKKLVG